METSEGLTKEEIDKLIPFLRRLKAGEPWTDEQFGWTLGLWERATNAQQLAIMMSVEMEALGAKYMIYVPFAKNPREN